MTGVQIKTIVLHSVHYNAEKKLLVVELHAGDLYQYIDVPEPVYQSLIQAESKEQYFDRQIRLKYRHRRLIQI